MEKAIKKPRTISVTCANCPSKIPRLWRRSRLWLTRRTTDFAAEAKIRKMMKIEIARMAFGSREVAVSMIRLVLFQALVRSIPINSERRLMAVRVLVQNVLAGTAPRRASGRASDHADDSFNFKVIR